MCDYVYKERDITCNIRSHTPGVNRDERYVGKSRVGRKAALEFIPRIAVRCAHYRDDRRIAGIG